MLMGEGTEPEDVADAVIFAVRQPPKTRVFLIGMRPMNESLGGAAFLHGTFLVFPLPVTPDAG